MFKDFSALNQLAPDLVETSVAQEVRNALGVESDLVGMINDSVSSYVDVYNRIRFTRINPDTRTPEDVTTSASNSAANSVLARLRARLTERAQLLSVYKENISDSFSNTEITRDVQIAVPPLTVGVPTTVHSGFVLAGSWLPVGESNTDAEVETALSAIPLVEFPFSSTTAVFIFRAIFIAFGSFMGMYEKDSNQFNFSYAEHVDGDLNIGHLIYMRDAGHVSLGTLYWRTSTGTGAAFFSGQTRTSLSGIGTRKDALKAFLGASSVTLQDTISEITKTLIPRISVVDSVSKEETFTVSGADVVNTMFVSNTAIESAISALADTQ